MTLPYIYFIQLRGYNKSNSKIKIILVQVVISSFFLSAIVQENKNKDKYVEIIKK